MHESIPNTSQTHSNLHQHSQSGHLLLLRRPSITPHKSHHTLPPTPNLPNLPRSLMPTSHLSSPTMAATESNVRVATHAPEPPATPNCDPFVDDTKPRHDRGSLAALMAAIQQVSKCLLAFTWHAPRPSPFLCVSTTLNPSLSPYGSLQLLPNVHLDHCASTVHTFSGCSDSACSTATAIAQGGSQIQDHHP
jgi:hypothetical protein